MCLYNKIMVLIQKDVRSMDEREDAADVAADILEEIGWAEDAIMFRWWAGVKSGNSTNPSRKYHTIGYPPSNVHRRSKLYASWNHDNILPLWTKDNA